MGPDPTRPIELPAKIGRYSVLGYLADGGMAEIFLGRDLGRPVVIKRILPHLARQQAFVSMFIDEARIGSLVKHPNVVETRELGQVGNDLFMVMEYLAGESVSGLLRRLTLRERRLPFALAAYIVAEACAGLHAAHELADDDGKLYGLVHRDISPSNLFITYDGEVKVLDFGVATAAHRLTRTATGQVKGKFSYMSPEQCLGDGLDRRSDLFSLGVVLYELSTRHRLFKRANELLVLRAVTQEHIPLPSRKIADYPAVLERVTMRSLSRDRDRRHQSALELRNELLAAIHGTTGDPRAALAELMIDLFPERIAEKTELVRRVRLGTDLPMIPAAEVDENVEMPQVEVRGTDVTGTAPRPVRAWVVLLVLVLALGGGGGAYWYTQTRKPEPAAPVVRMVATPPAPVMIDAKEPLVLHVDSIPTGATLFVDGEQRGTTPFDITLDEPRRIAIEVRLDGRTSVQQELDLDRTQRLLIPLPEAPKQTTPTKKTKPTKRDPFERFD
jgi:hypothetical protein